MYFSTSSTVFICFFITQHIIGVSCVEDSHLENLTCAECVGDTERECTLTEIQVQCAPGEVCTTIEAFSLATFTTIVTRQCFNLTEPNCDFNRGCSALNFTGDIQSCDQFCCNTSLCNAGITTDAPTTSGVTTGGPTTGAPTTGAPTTGAPTTAAPTTTQPRTVPTTEPQTTTAPATTVQTTMPPTTTPTLAPTTPLTGNLGTVDYVAIGTSLGIAVFLLIFIAFFLWRAQKNPQGTFGGRAEMGEDNLGMSANKAEQVRIQTISMTPLPQANGH